MPVPAGPRSRPRPQVRRSEFDRVLVVSTRFLGAGFVAYLLISIPGFGQPPGMVAPWFTPVAAIAVFGPGLGLLPATFLPEPRRLIRILAAGTAAGCLLSLGLWFVAWSGAQTGGEVLWLRNFTGLPPIVVATVFGIRRGGALLVINSGLSAWVAYLGRVSEVRVNPVSDALFLTLVPSGFMLGMWMATRTGRLLDETLPAVIAAAEESGSVEARNAERVRFDALIHDKVIATLVAITSRPDDPRLPEQARMAIAELDQFGAGGVPQDAEVDGNETAARLRSMVAAIDPETPVDVDPVGDAAPEAVTYPENVVRALSEAVGEAMRNSVRHAGTEAARGVLIELAQTRIRVTVVDDGAGFEPQAVSPRRLGIEVSIRRRMSALGGYGKVHSVVGRGTTVEMSWNRPG